jgi:predicted HAD superfamily Cof-like phosphohydrolase
MATLNVPTRAYSDINDLVKISANTFMDSNTQNLWQVVDTGNVKYLSRQSDEDVAEIVQARRDKKGNREARFANVKTAAPMALAGDQVKFMSPQNVILLGEVSSISDAKAVIKANGSSYSIDCQAILQIVERSGSNLKTEKSNLQDYFTKAFGDAGFAKELTKETTQEVHDGLGSSVPTSPSKPKGSPYGK